MTVLGRLRAEVEAAYDRLGMPSWPDPHPDRSPRDEEYSRVTDPGRYGIVHVRGRVWVDRLAEVPGVRVEPLAPAPLDGDGHLGWFDRGVRVTAGRPGTLPLLVLERDAPVDGGDGSLAVLHVSVVRPDVAVAMLPDCGCDACDTGSENLLGAVDDAVGRVVGGPFVALRAGRWQAQWSPGAGGSGGTPPVPDHAQLMEMCRRLAAGDDVRLPERTEAFVGHAWFEDL